ncbi:hypothetical protein [Carnobacterium maltaromaticum]|uniref:hypothetical protein n=1 Tax=Carnobacterium maltaromaticum TaxID=2751 RepID=UPI0012FC6374|nr:hypothetical protein [Carnobacterium maltaromaticum]
MILEKIFKGMGDAAQVIQRNFDVIIAEFLKMMDLGWVPIALKNGATGDARLCKIGKLIILEFTATGPTAGAGTGGANSFLQIPAGYRPARDFTITAGTNSSTAEGLIRLSSANGDATMWKSDNVAATHNTSFVYRLA